MGNKTWNTGNIKGTSHHEYKHDAATKSVEIRGFYLILVPIFSECMFDKLTDIYSIWFEKLQTAAVKYYSLLLTKYVILIAS